MAIQSNRTLLSTAVILLISFTALASGRALTTDYEDYITEDQQEVIDYALGFMQGFSKGYHQQFYHNKKEMDNTCFSTESQDEMEQIVYFVYNGELKDIMTTYDDVQKLFYDNFYSCGYFETIVDLKFVCQLTPDACTFSFFMSNVSKNIFKLIEAANSLMDVTAHFSLYWTPEQAYEYMFDLGEVAGIIITVLFGI